MDKLAPPVPPAPEKGAKGKKAGDSKTKDKKKHEKKTILGKRSRSPVASEIPDSVNSEAEQDRSSKGELGKLKTRRRSYPRGS